MNFTSLKERYLDSLSKYSNMQQYLPILAEYASKVNHVTEFGVRAGCSTCAFLYAKPQKMIAYDIKKYDGVDELINLSRTEGINFEYKLESTLTTEIEPTELLFIDSDHNYSHIKTELALHANKVSKYIIFHDVVQFGRQGTSEGSIGIMPAINEFLDKNKEWKTILFRSDVPGLMIISRC